MTLRLFQKRNLYWPTPLGLLIILLTTFSPAVLWVVFGERFLAETRRVPADVLVVESWIGRDGVDAAKAEFERGGYNWIISVGVPLNDRWSDKPWDYAGFVARELVAAGIPQESVILARTSDTYSQRTFCSALAVREALAEREIRTRAINVMTVGVHARRSQAVFGKVLGDKSQIGVISISPRKGTEGPWWRSSARAEELLKETIGWLYELLLNSGRLSNDSP